MRNLLLHKILSQVENDRIKNNLKAITVRELLLWFLLVTLGGMLLYTACELWWPITPMRVDEIVLSQTEVNRGQDMYFTFKGEKFKPYPVHVAIELTNGERISLINYISNNPVGSLSKSRSFVVPYHVMPGKYRIKWTGVYEVNAIRSITYVAYSDWLTVK